MTREVANLVIIALREFEQWLECRKVPEMHECLDGVSHDPLVVVVECLDAQLRGLFVCGKVPKRPNARRAQLALLVTKSTEQRDTRLLDEGIICRDVKARRARSARR